MNRTQSHTIDEIELDGRYLRDVVISYVYQPAIAGVKERYGPYIVPREPAHIEDLEIVDAWEIVTDDDGEESTVYARETLQELYDIDPDVERKIDEILLGVK